jgi:hypothetical protein
MTALLWLALFCAAVGTVQTGRAVEYRAGLFERVYSVRIHQGLVRPGWQGGFASTPYCSNIGRIIHARFRSPVVGNRSASWGKVYSLLVSDCSASVDRPRHVRSGLIVEVDWQTACSAGWCRDGHSRAQVIWGDQTWRP